ncbi:MAG TPA: DNA cytosine methyltransferase [Caulobacteraceae bacterium]
MERPIAIDLFAGAGGMSLGFEQAGFDVVAAVEIDPIHAAAHKFNFPHCAVLARSVVGLTGQEIRRAAGIGDGSVDVVIGGAPCQGFSMIGHRAMDDPRNSLVRDFVRIVCELEAKHFVFENVKGLTVGRHRIFLEELIREFSSVGYSLREPWRVLNAANYGVPQDRQRLFLLGSKRGFEVPKYPAATTRLPKERWRSLPDGPTCEDALSDLPDAERYPVLNFTDEVVVLGWPRPQNEYAQDMRCLTNRAWWFGHPREWRPQTLTSSMRTDHTDISRRRFGQTPPGSVEPISRFFRLSAKGISSTLRAGTDAARGAFTSPRPIHYRYARCVTVREMARLHGFPDWFRFHETKWNGARQIGNAVPPPLARAVASSVIWSLGTQPTQPTQAVALGDDALLRMAMVDASHFWSVVTPIARRTRKSGARKRKQLDIEADRLRTMGR